MNAVQTKLAHSLPVEAPPSPTLQTPTRRRRRRNPESQRLTRALCAVTLAASALLTYVFGCATATRHSYRLNRLRERLRTVQSERKLLEAQVADLQRTERVLFLAKQQGMAPREALQFVALVPAANDHKVEQPAAREIRQASVR